MCKRNLGEEERMTIYSKTIRKSDASHKDGCIYILLVYITFISTVFAVILSYFSLTFMEFKCALFAKKKQFKFKTARNRHEKTVHIGSIEKECQSCRKKINRKDNFDRHVRTCQI